MDIGNGRYHLIRRLGSGGTGVVYQAADLVLGRVVTVKALQPSYALDLLRREGRSLARLSHPCVVALYDLVEEDGRAYLVMEYVDGHDLQRWLNEHGPLHLDQALLTFHQIAAAIRHAHAHGVLHCDLKPANVLVSTRGEVKLTDFTLAQVMALTGFNGARGASPAYAAPEQLHGGSIDVRTDVYGLGVLLRHMIEPIAHGSQDAEQVFAVIERATAEDPAMRFVSVDEMIRALPLSTSTATRVTASSGVSDLTRIAPAAQNSQRVSRRRRYLWPLALLPVTLSASGAFLVVHFNASASPTKVPVPDLRGLPQSRAGQIDRSLSLRTQITRSYSVSVAAGDVISQAPVAGTRLEAGSRVTLTVSKGPQPILIPYVVGLSRDDAVARLERSGFSINVDTQDSIDVDPGTILGQQPDAGTSTLPGTTVRITVSTHPWWWWP